MAIQEDEFHKTGGTADVKQNPPSTEGPGAKHNPDETRQGNNAGQVSQEGERPGKDRPTPNSGAPG